MLAASTHAGEARPASSFLALVKRQGTVTVDWIGLDLNVEHLSIQSGGKDTGRYDPDSPIVYRRIVTNLLSYVAS